MLNTATTFPQTYQVQYSFHFDVTQRLLELARALPDEVYRAQIGYSHDSIHNTFAHLLGADTFWRHVIADRPIPRHGPQDISGLDALVAMLEIERTSWHELLGTFNEASLLGTITRRSPIGTRVIPIWRTLQHVMFHGMQHQTELARMLTDVGQSPGDIDFFWDEAATA